MRDIILFFSILEISRADPTEILREESFFNAESLPAVTTPTTSTKSNSNSTTTNTDTTTYTIENHRSNLI